LFQRIVHAAVLSTGALSACAYERTTDDQLVGTALEGLFPPQRPLPGEGGTPAIRDPRKSSSNMSCAPKNYAVGEGLIGSVAK